MKGKDGHSPESMRRWSRRAFASAIAVLVAGTYLSLGGYSFAATAPAKVVSAAKSAVSPKTRLTPKTDSAAADQYEPPRSVCTFTKGYFRNHPEAVTSLTIDSHSFTKAQVVSVLRANPNSVKLSPKNNVLNLAQQLFAAQLNINRGAVPPPSVISAISTAIASLTFTFDAGGRVTAISSTLSASQIGALVETLSSFNEGKLTSGGHCGSASRIESTVPPPVTRGTINEATPRAGTTPPRATAPAGTTSGAATSLPFTGLSLLSTALVSIAFVIGGTTLRRRATLSSP